MSVLFGALCFAAGAVAGVVAERRRARRRMARARFADALKDGLLAYALARVSPEDFSASAKPGSPSLPPLSGAGIEDACLAYMAPLRARRRIEAFDAFSTTFYRPGGGGEGEEGGEDRLERGSRIEAYLLARFDSEAKVVEFFRDLISSDV